MRAEAAFKLASFADVLRAFIPRQTGDEKCANFQEIVVLAGSSWNTFCAPIHHHWFSAFRQVLSPSIIPVTCSFFHLGIKFFLFFHVNHLTSLLAFFLEDAFLLFSLSIVPFKSHPFHLNTCPIHFFFLLRITSIGVLFSFTISNTWSFVTLSFQPILSILQSIDFIFPHCPRFRTIYNATVHTTALIIFFFNFLSILCVNSPLLLLARKSALK